VNQSDLAGLEAIVRDRNSLQKHFWLARIALQTATGIGTTGIMRRAGRNKAVSGRSGSCGEARGSVARQDAAVMHSTATGAGRNSNLDPRGDPAVHPPLDGCGYGARVRHQRQFGAADLPGTGLKPHRIRRFKLSRHPEFVSKLRDIVEQPAYANVHSVGENSQIQALNRTKPGLPLKPRRCRGMTHCKRNGSPTLFAAVDMLDGKVCVQRDRHREFIRFRNTVEAEIPDRKAVHVILENFHGQKRPKGRAWLDRSPQFGFY
jgi:hypothetical protein